MQFDPRTWNEGARTIAAAIAAGVVLIMILLAGWWLTEPARARARAAQAQAAAVDAQNKQKAAQDAINTVAEQARKEGAEDALSQENGNAIHAAQGSAAHVDPAVHSAGLRALCLRNAYRGQPACKQLR